MSSGKLCETQPLHRGRRLAFLHGETGSQIVELALVISPLLAVVFLFVDAAWLFFAQASLQNAVQTGVRAAVTSYVPAVNGQTPGFESYLKSVVQSNAMGFLSGQTGSDAISICFYSPTNLSPTSPCLSGPGADSGGNVVQISVNAVPVSILGPVFGNASPSLALSATSSDVMEGSPATGPPAL